MPAVTCAVPGPAPNTTAPVVFAPFSLDPGFT